MLNVRQWRTFLLFTEVGNNNGVIVDGGVDAHTHASIYEVQLWANIKMAKTQLF